MLYKMSDIVYKIYLNQFCNLDIIYNILDFKVSIRDI